MVFTLPTHPPLHLISLLLYACPPSLQRLSLSPPLPPPPPLPSPFSEAGDMQALANLNAFAKQYLRLRASQCWF